MYRIPDSNIAVLGCSLFSAVPPKSEMAVSFGLNDFFQTNAWDVAQHNEAHKRDLTWLNDQSEHLRRSDSEIIILTHWSPSTDARSVDPKHGASPIASAFSTDLSDQACFKNEKVRVWAFGHTHYNCDFQAERGGADPLRLVTNQRGYYFAQADGFDVTKTINLD
jgi:hypothetical protein